MVDKRTLNEYLDEIRRCEDINRLTDELKIYDNFPALLYGNQDELVAKIVRDLNDFPKALGNSWRSAGHKALDRDMWGVAQPHLKGNQAWFFVHEFNATLQLINRPAPYSYGGEENRIGGEDHSVFVSFHGNNIKDWDQMERGIALAVASFGDYIIREGLTARFPKTGLEINYVPE